MSVQTTERPPSQRVSEMALEGPNCPSTSHHPPRASPHNLRFTTTTLPNLHAGNPSHEWEDLQDEIAHGEQRVTTAITSPSRTKSPYRRTQEHFPSPDAIPLPHRILLTLKLCASTLPATTPFMPRLRGKSRGGAARGRKMPNSNHLSNTEMSCVDIPPDFDALPVLPSITVPAPAEPQLEATQELSPLSNEYRCRVEWFDAFRDSLGYAPPPPSPPPPCQPPPTFSLSRHLSEATSAPSPHPST